jgi:hypothetical protein
LPTRDEAKTKVEGGATDVGATEEEEEEEATGLVLALGTGASGPSMASWAARVPARNMPTLPVPTGTSKLGT